MLQRRIKEDDGVLVVRDIRLEKIFSGTKWLEIRPHSVKQGRIYLCQSKTSTVFGHARVEEVLGPLRADEWETLREGHGVPGGRLYQHTYAWVLRDVQRLEPPVRIRRKPGSVGLQYGSGV